MKTKINKILSGLIKLTLVMLVVSFTFYSCKEDEGDGTPNVTKFRVVEKDSSITSGAFGLYIAIQGSNLQSVREVWFNDIQGYINPNFVTSSNIIVSIPGTFPAEITNKVVLKTENKKEYTYDFLIEVPKPIINKTEFAFGKTGNTLTLTGANFAQVKTITVGGKAATKYEISPDFKTVKISMPSGVPASVIQVKVEAVAGNVETSFDLAAASMPAIKSVSNEYAPAGKKIRLFGNNFANLLYIKLNDIAATNIVEADDYSYAEFVVPSGVTPGVVNITAANEYGVSSYKIYYQYDSNTDIVIFNFDDKKACWGKQDIVDEPDQAISGAFAQWKGEVFASWWDDSKYVCACAPHPLSKSDPSKYAVKFELNVLKEWNNSGAITITFNGDKYSYDYKPYAINGQNTPFKTNGWITVTIPLSSFGGGLTDATTLNDCRFKFMVKGNETTLDDVLVQADNLRIVEIKPLN